jgi:purine-binding chemotaxis protein CheW
LSSPPSGLETWALRLVQQVAQNWLPGLTLSAIFVSSIEMANPPALHAVVFRIGEVVCAAPAGIVREILPRLPATRIPGVADTVEGLVNVRGSLLTVLDGHLLLQQERRPSDEGAIVVLEVKGRIYGLGVGQVLDFLEVPAGSVVERRELPGVDPRLVKAVGLAADRHFILLDVEAVFAPIIGG